MFIILLPLKLIIPLPLSALKIILLALVIVGVPEAVD